MSSPGADEKQSVTIAKRQETKPDTTTKIGKLLNGTSNNRDLTRYISTFLDSSSYLALLRASKKIKEMFPKDKSNAHLAKTIKCLEFDSSIIQNLRKKFDIIKFEVIEEESELTATKFMNEALKALKLDNGVINELHVRAYKKVRFTSNDLLEYRTKFKQDAEKLQHLLGGQPVLYTEGDYYFVLFDPTIIEPILEKRSIHQEIDVTLFAEMKNTTPATIIASLDNVKNQLLMIIYAVVIEIKSQIYHFRMHNNLVEEKQAPSIIDYHAKQSIVFSQWPNNSDYIVLVKRILQQLEITAEVSSFSLHDSKQSIYTNYIKISQLQTKDRLKLQRVLPAAVPFTQLSNSVLILCRKVLARIIFNKLEEVISPEMELELRKNRISREKAVKIVSEKSIDLFMIGAYHQINKSPLDFYNWGIEFTILYAQGKLYYHDKGLNWLIEIPATATQIEQLTTIPELKDLFKKEKALQVHVKAIEQTLKASNPEGSKKAPPSEAYKYILNPIKPNVMNAIEDILKFKFRNNSICVFKIIDEPAANIKNEIYFTLTSVIDIQKNLSILRNIAVETRIADHRSVRRCKTITTPYRLKLDEFLKSTNLIDKLITEAGLVPISSTSSSNQVADISHCRADEKMANSMSARI